MRNVLSNGREVYHYFANKVQPSGRAGNSSFALPRAYSYAACIGQHFTDGVALSNGKWSVTTSKHRSYLRQACRHLTCIYVPCPDDVQISWTQVKLTVESLLKLASTAKSKRDGYLGDALRQVADFNVFAQWCGSDLHIDAPVTDPDALAAIAATVKGANAERKAAIAEWRAGANLHLPYDLPVALRIVGDTIQTTKGAQIPLDQAPTIWAMVNRKKAWAPRDPIGVYQLTQIRDNGDIVVGCHDIAFAELAIIAEQLGYAK